MEAAPPVEDPSFRVAPTPEASHDTDTPSTNVPGQPGELSSLQRRRRRLRPPLLPVPSRAGDVAVGKCGPPWDHIDRGVLGLPVRRLLPAGSRLEVHLRRAMGNLDAQK